ncbi:MAG: hypothetical protein GX601_08915 [Anaerolineales bacterium]|nr:hypothetical protein [Anaerolineales bacterium]
MRSDLQTLFWLQWKLTQAMFRSRRGDDRMRAVGLILRLLSISVTLPMAVIAGIGMIVGLVLLPAGAAYEVVVIVNTVLFLIWLVLPASYNSQVIERFEMSRLFAYPMRFRSIVVGSTLISLFTPTGIWTAPLLVGEIIGLTYHQPLAFPLIVIGAIPVFALLVLSGRIMDDAVDLVAGDRRLRALVLTLLSLPFIACWLGQYVIQLVTANYSKVPQLGFLSGLERLNEAHTIGEFLQLAGVSRLLVWLPPGWSSAGMGLAVTGDWLRALAFLAISLTFVALLLLVHARITRKLMEGAALRLGAERVRSRRWRLPGPAVLSALFHKDWNYLWRSPMPRRLLFSAVVIIVAMAAPMLNTSRQELPQPIQQAIPLVTVAGMLTLLSMALNTGMSANYFGAMDREGFGTLSASGLDRRYVLLSANLTTLLFALAQSTVLVIVVALVTRSWVVAPLGLYLALCLQIGGAPAYNLASIIGPYRTQLKYTGGRQRGSMWGLLAWLVATPPVLLLIVLPYVVWKPGLGVMLPLGLVYALGLYALTLKPLARLLQRREHTILQAITAQD